MQRVTPMRLLRIPEAFDHPDFVFEPKIDGFRGLAYIRGHHDDPRALVANEDSGSMTSFVVDDFRIIVE